MTMTPRLPRQPLGARLREERGVALVIALMAMVVLPLPPFLLDAFFTFNITLSLVIMLAVIYVARPLDFAVFPTVLLAITLLRRIRACT